MIARIAVNLAGVIAGRWTNGAFWTDGSFRAVTGTDGNRVWSEDELPVLFATQLDISSTINGLGGKTVAGRCSAKVVGEQHARGFKTHLTLDQLVGNKHSTFTLSPELYAAIVAFYSVHSEERIAA